MAILTMPIPKLPPGPSFILNQLLSWEFVSFTATVYTICIVNEALGRTLPMWVVVSCSILAFPCILLVRARYQYWRDGRMAASLGARLAPTVPTRLPGGVDLIATWMRAFRTGYIGVYIYSHLVPRDSLKFLQVMDSLIGLPRVARRSTCALWGHLA